MKVEGKPPKKSRKKLIVACALLVIAVGLALEGRSLFKIIRDSFREAEYVTSSYDPDEEQLTEVT